MIRLYKHKFRVNSLRLKGYDYSLPRHYFVTICTRNKKHYFGEINNWEMRLSDIGKIVSKEWQETFKIRENVILDEWVIMPNHMHMIVFIDKIVETHCNASLHETKCSNKFGPQKNNLASIVRGFKSATTKTINLKYGKEYFSWQPRYYDRVIRNHYELECTRKYIRENPQNWDQHNNNIENISDEIKRIFY